MKPVDQTKFYEKGVSYGNCMQACVASYLELPLESVPDFSLDWEHFWSSVYSWMDSEGLRIRLVTPWKLRDHEYYLVQGVSPRSTEDETVYHMVIYLDGKLIHDPHPSRLGVTEILSYRVIEMKLA
jgi:hypothetical protein